MESSCITLDRFHSDFEQSEQAAEKGPVYLTVDGDAHYVLLNYEDYAAMVRLARLPDLRTDQLTVSFMEDEPVGASAASNTLSLRGFYCGQTD